MRTKTITITINTPQQFDPSDGGRQHSLLDQIDDVIADYPVEFEDWKIDVDTGSAAEAVQDLVGKINWLLFDSGIVECPEGTFCFPDGDIWRRSDG